MRCWLSMGWRLESSERVVRQSRNTDSVIEQICGGWCGSDGKSKMRLVDRVGQEQGLFMVVDLDQL